LKLVN